MEYPTLEGRLIMPEYGRNIQHMVQHALSIQDREERTLCVKSIIHIMGNMFPYLRDVNDFKHKLWDHVAIMSDFKLDIDYPYDVLKENIQEARPEAIAYQQSTITYLHYGRTLEQMIEKLVEYPEGEEKKKFMRLVAGYMKRSFLTWNKEPVDDKKIYDDLRELSKGRLEVTEEPIKLSELRPASNNNKKVKPKKK